MSTTIPKMYESMSITNVPHYTIKEYVAKTKTFMDDQFIPYHPSSNNCQDFCLSVLKSNGISEGHDFVKQDTTMIFKNKNVKFILFFSSIAPGELFSIFICKKLCKSNISYDIFGLVLNNFLL